MLKSFMDSQNVVRFFGLFLILLWVSVSGCSKTSDIEQTKSTDQAPDINLAEGSGSQTEVLKKAAARLDVRPRSLDIDLQRGPAGCGF